MIKSGLKKDRLRQASKVGSTVEYLIISDPLLIKETWIRTPEWYKDALEHPPLPYIVSIAIMMAERVELYRNVPPQGYPISMGYLPFLVDEAILEEEEIAWEVHRLCLNCSGSLLVMREDHLFQWLIAVTRDN